jgi:hypothetical protein
MAEDSLKSVVAEHKPRDEHGHFVKKDIPQAPTTPKNIATKLLEEINGKSANVKESSDDLIDIHVGNPLRKIVTLLQEIKQQKAFSFTLKGSLGIAGVALALGVFGVFGGGQILCERGVQSQIGEIKVLNSTEKDPSIPLISDLLNLISTPKEHNRVVLVKNDETVIGLTGQALISNHSSLITPYVGMPVVATGNYNSCSQTLNIVDGKDIQIYAK